VLDVVEQSDPRPGWRPFKTSEAFFDARPPQRLALAPALSHIATHFAVAKAAGYRAGPASPGHCTDKLRLEPEEKTRNGKLRALSRVVS
jgi:hypothetical protein